MTESWWKYLLVCPGLVCTAISYHSLISKAVTTCDVVKQVPDSVSLHGVSSAQTLCPPWSCHDGWAADTSLDEQHIMPCYQLLTTAPEPKGGPPLVSVSPTLILQQLWSIVLEWHLSSLSLCCQLCFYFTVAAKRYRHEGIGFVCHCRWPRLGLFTAPVRMSLMSPAASSVWSSLRDGSRMTIPGKKNNSYLYWIL